MCITIGVYAFVVIIILVIGFLIQVCYMENIAPFKITQETHLESKNDLNQTKETN